MIDVEAIKLAVGREIDSGLTLGIKDHARRVHHRLLARQ